MGGVIQRAQIGIHIVLTCCSCCKQQDFAFHKDGADGLQQVAFFDASFLIEYALAVYGWVVEPDGRSWCPFHKADPR